MKERPMASKTKRKGLSPGEAVFCLAVLVTVIFILKPDILRQDTSKWTPEMRARHLVARTGCRGAQSVGLGHAHRGQPGYWPEWDGDNDGISCERW